MRILTEEDIRTRAYKLWKAAGESTKCDAFWYQAEKKNEAPQSRLVFIGRDLPVDLLKQGFKACRA
jgi:hypothetical protein